MPDIHFGLAQYSPNAPDHPWLIRIATEQDISFGHELRPVAANLHDARLALHDRSAQYINILIAGAGFARERRNMAVRAQHM